MRAGIASIIFLLALLGMPGTAHGACEAPPDLETALRAAPVAFVGRVDQTDISTGETAMTVLWVWKGENVPEQVDLVRPRSAAGVEDPGIAFTKNGTYLVTPSNDSSPFQISECGGTRRYRADGQVIPAELQGVTARSEALPPGVSAEATEEDGGALPWTPVAIGVVVAVGIAMVIVRQRSRRDPDAPRSRRFRKLAGLSWRGRSGSTHVRKMRRRRK